MEGVNFGGLCFGGRGRYTPQRAHTRFYGVQRVPRSAKLVAAVVAEAQLLPQQQILAVSEPFEVWRG